MRLLLLLLASAALAKAQDGCRKTGCSGPWGAGRCQRNRCVECPTGFTGLRCQRPCQDMMQQCVTRWKRENRCDHRTRTAFFDDNCPMTCGICTPGDYELEVPIPILAEQVAWVTGRWETDSQSGDRFPIALDGPYHEILDIRPEKVTMFDRPSLNVSITAYPSSAPSNVHREVGFLTSRFGNEDTGFVRQKGDPSIDAREIGLSLNSNTGLNTVEEGVMSDGGGRIEFSLKWAFALPGLDKPTSATRTWDVVGDTLTESLSVDYPSGRRVSAFKTFRRTFDYLEPQLKGSHASRRQEVRKTGVPSASSASRSVPRGPCGPGQTQEWVFDDAAFDWVLGCAGGQATRQPKAQTNWATTTTSTPAPSGNWKWQNGGWVERTASVQTSESNDAAASSSDGAWRWDGAQWVESEASQPNSAFSNYSPAASDDRQFTWEWSDARNDWLKRYY